MGENDIDKMRKYFLTAWDQNSHVYFETIISECLKKLSEMSSVHPILGEKNQEPHRAIMPDDGFSDSEITQILFRLIPGSFDYSHPKSILAASPPITIVSLVASTLTQYLNQNIAWGSWGGNFSQIELDIVSILSKLVGYDEGKAGGVFTYGGGGTLLYGVKVGVSKSVPDSIENGFSIKTKIFATKNFHYSKNIAANWLGLGLSSLVEIPVDENGEIIKEDFNDVLVDTIKNGYKIGAILLEAGSTYELSIDEIKDVVDLRDRLILEYDLDYSPHIHIDAVISWVFKVFADYDFEKNPLILPEEVLPVVKNINRKLSNLFLADSIGIDFHKLGFVPLTSSCVLFKDGKDLNLIASIPGTSHFSLEEYNPGIYTLECSRSPIGVTSAYINCLLLGKKGFRVLLGYLVNLTLTAAKEINNLRNRCVLINKDISGPALVFRLYSKENDTDLTYRQELDGIKSALEIKRENKFNQEVCQRINTAAISKNVGMISYVEEYKRSSSGENVGALKVFISNPFATNEIVIATIGEISKIINSIKS